MNELSNKISKLMPEVPEIEVEENFVPKKIWERK